MTSLTRPNTTDDGVRNTTNLPGTTITGLPGWSRFDDIFESMFSEVTRKDIRVRNLDDHIEWSIDMPGVGEENIEVLFKSGNTLTVQTSYGETSEDADYERVEQRHYVKTMKLGDNIDTENIDASYEDGVLTVTLPKVEQNQETRQIELD